MKELFLIVFAVCSLISTAVAGDWLVQQKQHDRERAEYWAERGYKFNSEYMTAWSMDQKVKDIERAKYWKERGHDFGPNYMTAWAMDQAVVQNKNERSTSKYQNAPGSSSSYPPTMEPMFVVITERGHDDNRGLFV